MTEPAHRADRLFKEQDPNYDPEIHRLAQRIEWGDAMDPSDFIPLGDKINQRHGKDITLLFHAISSGNTPAVDALLAAGADTEMPDKATGSTRSFVYYLTLPGGSLLDMDGVNRMLASYLKYGGDPNATFGEKAVSQGNLSDGLALIKNLDGFRMALAAGADPWKMTWSNGQPYSHAMTSLAFNQHFAMLDQLIDEGYFDARTQAEIQGFLGDLGTYAQRRDDASRDIKRIAKRVLKRHPDYVETATGDEATRRIFKDHWQDSAPGVIPWDEIQSDAVK